MSRRVLTLSVVAGFAAAGGLLREIWIADRFGAGINADALALCLMYLEGLTVVVLSGSVLVLTPIAIRLASAGRGEDVNGLVTLAAAVTLAIGVPAVVVSQFFAELCARAMAPAFSEARHAPLALLVRAAGPAAVMQLMAAWFAGYCQARGAYYAPVLGRGVFSVALGLTVWIAAARLDIRAAAVGLWIGAALQLALTATAAHRAGWRVVTLSVRHPELAPTLRALLPVLVAIIVWNFVTPGVQRLLTSDLPSGTFASVGYAHRLLAVVALISLSSATVATTDIASKALDEAECRQSLLSHFTNLMLVTTPIASAMVAFADPIVELVYRRGQYDTAAAVETARALRWMAAVTVLGGAYGLMQRSCAALHRPDLVLKIAVPAALLTLVGTLAFKPLGGALAIAVGFAVGVVTAWLCGLLAVRALLGGEIARAIAGRTVRLHLLGAAAGAGGWLVYVFMTSRAWPPVPSLMTAAAALVGVYLLAVPEARRLARGVSETLVGRASFRKR